MATRFLVCRGTLEGSVCIGERISKGASVDYSAANPPQAFLLLDMTHTLPRDTTQTERCGETQEGRVSEKRRGKKDGRSVEAADCGRPGASNAVRRRVSVDLPRR